jgi:hypothetical protein
VYRAPATPSRYNRESFVLNVRDLLTDGNLSMERVSIRRNQKLPDCCAICGQSPTRVVVLKFAPRDDESLAKVLLVPKLIRLFLRVYPSIEWPLPFCEAHASQVRMKQRLQPVLLLAGGAVFGLGGWSLIGTHLTWPFVCSAFVGVLLTASAHHLKLAPHRTTRHLLELTKVDGNFLEEYDEINKLPPIPATNPDLDLHPESNDGDSIPDFTKFQ